MDSRFKFPLKIRSLPNENNYKDYLNLYMLTISTFAGVSFVHFCLIADGLIPLSPIWLLILLPLVTIYRYLYNEDQIQEISKDDFKALLVDIRQGQFQSLKEKIEARPEFLRYKYQGHSLLYWCKKYQSLKANKIIIEQLRKAS